MEFPPPECCTSCECGHIQKTFRCLPHEEEDMTAVFGAGRGDGSKVPAVLPGELTSDYFMFNS